MELNAQFFLGYMAGVMLGSILSVTLYKMTLNKMTLNLKKAPLSKQFAEFLRQEAKVAD